MSTFETTYEEFYKQSGEFFRLAETAETLEEVENGAKAVHLLYLGIKNDLTPRQTVSSMAIMRLVDKELGRFDPVVTNGIAALERLKQFVKGL